MSNVRIVLPVISHQGPVADLGTGGQHQLVTGVVNYVDVNLNVLLFGGVHGFLLALGITGRVVVEVGELCQCVGLVQDLEMAFV